MLNVSPILTLLLLVTMYTPTLAVSIPQLHQQLLARSEGYFAHEGGTGGQGGRVVYVTTLANSGPGSLRSYMESTETLIILFAVEGTINLTEHIDVKSNKTSWGINSMGQGMDILIHPANTKSAFTINDGEGNVIYSNLKANALFGTDDNAPDWLRVSEAGGIVWVDHTTAIGDGTKNMDGFVDGHTKGITLSWNRVENWDQVHRIASNGETTTVSLHHNLFINNRGRMPRLSAPDTFAHAWNNWLIDWRGHGMQSINGGELRAENNIFTAGSDDDAILGTWMGSGNVLEGIAVSSIRSQGLFVPPYEYTLDVTNQALRDRLMANAGWQAVIVPSPDSLALVAIVAVLYLIYMRMPRHVEKEDDKPKPTWRK